MAIERHEDGSNNSSQRADNPLTLITSYESAADYAVRKNADTQQYIAETKRFWIVVSSRTGVILAILKLLADHLL